MFNFFKSKINPGETWFYDPNFQTDARGKLVKIEEVGIDGIRISNIDGDFKPIMSKDQFLQGFKKFKN